MLYRILRAYNIIRNVSKTKFITRNTKIELLFYKIKKFKHYNTQNNTHDNA